MPRRPPDPFKNKSDMTALAVIVRTKAERIDTITDGVLNDNVLSDSCCEQLHKVKVIAQQIADLVEGSK